MSRALSGRYPLVLGIILYAAGVAFAVAAGSHSTLAAALRTVSILILCAWALGRRSLTVWIFWSMLAGVELGLDLPAFALHLHVLSALFLRLIEAIVAPLILGTLITGIAAHGDSREVPRLAVKSLVYFEILTLIALAAGLAAINIARPE